MKSREVPRVFDELLWRPPQFRRRSAAVIGVIREDLVPIGWGIGSACVYVYENKQLYPSAGQKVRRDTFGLLCKTRTSAATGQQGEKHCSEDSAVLRQKKKPAAAILAVIGMKYP